MQQGVAAMTRISRTNLLVFLILLKTAPAISQSLTLDKLYSMLQDHPLLKSEDLSPQLEQYNQDVTQTARNWRVRADQTYYYSQPVTSTTFAASEVQQVTFTGSANRAFWNTGGRLSLQWSSDLTHQEFPSLQFPGPGGGQHLIWDLTACIKIAYASPTRNRYGKIMGAHWIGSTMS